MGKYNIVLCSNHKIVKGEKRPRKIANVIVHTLVGHEPGAHLRMKGFA